MMSIVIVRKLYESVRSTLHTVQSTLQSEYSTLGKKKVDELD